MSVNKIYEQAIEIFGEDNQLFQLCEECAELIKAVNKWRRNKHLTPYFAAYKEDVAEEIADVEIMIEQTMKIMDIAEKDVSDIKYRKIKRLADRTRDAADSGQTEKSHKNT